MQVQTLSLTYECVDYLRNREKSVCALLTSLKVNFWCDLHYSLMQPELSSANVFIICPNRLQDSSPEHFKYGFITPYECCLTPSFRNAKFNNSFHLISSKTLFYASQTMLSLAFSIESTSEMGEKIFVTCC